MRAGLVEVGERVGVAAKLVVHCPQLVPDGAGAESGEIDDVKGRDVVRPAVPVIAAT